MGVDLARRLPPTEPNVSLVKYYTLSHIRYPYMSIRYMPYLRHIGLSGYPKSTMTGALRQKQPRVGPTPPDGPTKWTEAQKRPTADQQLHTIIGGICHFVEYGLHIWVLVHLA